jgi:hypothetical protein
MTVITKYIADDGREFEDEYDCRSYEMKLQLGILGDELQWFDWKGERIEISPDVDFGMDVCFVKIFTTRAADLLTHFCREEGYYSPCADSDFNTIPGRLGFFWYDNDKDSWRSLREEQEELDRIKEKFEKMS